MTYKKLFSMTLSLLFTLSITACGNPPEDLQSKIDQVHAITQHRERNSMGGVNKLFPDLELIRSTAIDDEYNITEISSEDWVYSKKDDITVIIWNHENSPLHIFKGTTLNKDQILEVKERLKPLIDSKK